MLCKIAKDRELGNETKITGQYGNRAIKEALQITGLFDDITQNKHKDTKENKRRFEAITLHKGRDSFITNLVDTTPLNELMKYFVRRHILQCFFVDFETELCFFEKY